MIFKKFATVATIAAASVLALGAQSDPRVRSPGEWRTWGGDLHNSRYSALDQINARNVKDLQVVWRWNATSLDGRPDFNWKSTPLMVDGLLYVPTGGNEVAALDPATGEQVWLFTPNPRRNGTRPFSGSTRALSYWTDGKTQRILNNSVDGRLYSLDAKTGKLDTNFGQNGFVDLREDLLEPGDTRKVADLGSTAPGIVVGDVYVVQVITNDGPPTKEQTPGYVRGYDVRTGKRLWVFHTIPRPGQVGHDTWKDEGWKYAGNASVWSMMSADPERGLVYLPIESATNNFYGGDRLGDGLFAESIVCLDAKTGKRVWHFQILHHGVWDYDLPAAPILHDVVKDGKRIPAVTVLTKQNMSFVFNRVTGEPVWPIEERPVPQNGVPGDVLSPTQPFPTRPAPYSNLGYHEEDLIDFTPELKAEAKAIADQYVKGPMYTPPSLVGPNIKTKGTIVYPGYGGGSNWNGGAVDPETNRMFVPTRNIFMSVGLREADPAKSKLRYVVGSGGEGNGGTMRGPRGLPMNKPPWSLINATDMNTGTHVWSRSIGGAPDWVRKHPALAGLELDFDNMGQISARPSPLVTKTLLFLSESGNIGGDPGGPMFRAYDKATGKVLAEHVLPGKTSGAPMTYSHKGRQYIVVAVSEQGHPAELVALALPTPAEKGKPAPIRGTPVAVKPRAARETIAITEAQRTDGRTIYAQSCAGCHGAQGEGSSQAGVPGLRNLGRLQDIRTKVAQGGPEMPPMLGILTPEQVDAVSRYVGVEFSRLGAPAAQ